MNIQEVLQLARLLPAHPIAAWDRAVAIQERRRDAVGVPAGTYSPITWNELLGELDRVVDARCSTFAREPACRAIESEVAGRQRARTGREPFGANYDGDMALGRLCYVIVRALAPETVVETGVAHGVTSAFMLKALDVNGHGNLHSIDLPPLATDARDYIGSVVPPELTGRWHLHTGASRRLLAPLVERLGAVDVFVHDSLHTYETMRREYETVTPFLQPGAAVISDDVQDNEAFARWSAARPSVLTAVLQEQSKDSLLGISIGTGATRHSDSDASYS